MTRGAILRFKSLDIRKAIFELGHRCVVARIGLASKAFFLNLPPLLQNFLHGVKTQPDPGARHLVQLLFVLRVGHLRIVARDFVGELILLRFKLVEQAVLAGLVRVTRNPVILLHTGVGLARRRIGLSPPRGGNLDRRNRIRIKVRHDLLCFLTLKFLHEPP
jgi:hypothetical protein